MRPTGGKKRSSSPRMAQNQARRAALACPSFKIIDGDKIIHPDSQQLAGAHFKMSSAAGKILARCRSGIGERAKKNAPGWRRARFDDGGRCPDTQHIGPNLISLLVADLL
jgi:hypothetical protein